MTYTPPKHYTSAELDSFALTDLISDAEQAEKQAAEGPFYPEKGITAIELLSYAGRCRKEAERFKDGGAHAAVLRG